MGPDQSIKRGQIKLTNAPDEAESVPESALNPDCSIAVLQSPRLAVDVDVAIPWAEWMASELNRIFWEQGVTGKAGKITAATVQHGERRRRGEASDEDWTSMAISKGIQSARPTRNPGELCFCLAIRTGLINQHEPCLTILELEAQDRDTHGSNAPNKPPHMHSLAARRII